ncbi:glycosyltransferase family 2 protein [Streptomyces sp. QH1-20]|uniref:glycosyltransferase family 2 protein n=1 Tax=Streptomyces sp. QH1-20 TaxID=3240934 RepID=UPI003515527E
MDAPKQALTAFIDVMHPVALLLSIVFITYVVLISVPYVRHAPRPPGDARDFAWHLFVPCRDEEAVIGATIAHLRAGFPHAHVWVIDDASVDGTARTVRSVAEADSRVHLVSRRLPEARTGKGGALNAAYRALDRWLPADTDRSRVIVGVIDADGRPAVDCLDMCAADHLFGNPEVSSVQVIVRMVNRDNARPFPRRGRLVNALGQALVRMQDLEFRVPISAIQLTRRHTRTVALGGNGQFTRLRALDTVRRQYGQPWGGSLLEDYELSVHLLLTGHRTAYTPDTYVDQEGLPSLRRLITQRTRWGQGTMQCCRYLPRLWNCRHLPKAGKLEVGYFLLAPWIQLFGTFAFLAPLGILACDAANPGVSPAAAPAWSTGGGLVLYMLLGMTPLATWGPLYIWRCEPATGLRGAIGYGLAYAVYIVVLFYVTSWRAFFRILRGRSTWSKTRRNAEAHQGTAAVET